MTPRAFTIAHFSDPHCGGPHFVPSLLERAIVEINELEPDLVVCSGDLTTFGFKQEYAQAHEYLETITSWSSRAITIRATWGTCTSRSSSESATRSGTWTR